MNARELVEKSRHEDLYFRDSYGCVIWIPAGWCDEFTVAKGFNGGPDGEEPDLYGYGSGTKDSDEHESFWYSIADLLSFQQVTEEQARAVDPNLFQYLADINSGKI